MSTAFSNFGSLDVKAAGEIAISVCTGFHEQNIFLLDYLAFLSEKLEILTKAIAQSKQHELMLEAKELHDELKQLFKEFKKLLISKIPLKSLGIESENCALIYDSIERHGGDIESLPRHAMLTTMQSVFNEFVDANAAVPVDAGVDPVFTELKRLLSELKQKEKERGELTILEESIPCESTASRETITVLTALYRHIRDYSKIGKEEYEEILNELDVKFAPIVVQVKSRETRHKHDMQRDELELDGSEE